MNIPLGNIVSVSDIQENYRKIFDKAKATKEPVVVMRGNKPEIALLDVNTLEELNKKLEELETADALRAIEEGDIELKKGKTIVAKSLADLIK